MASGGNTATATAGAPAKKHVSTALSAGINMKQFETELDAEKYARNILSILDSEGSKMHMQGLQVKQEQIGEQLQKKVYSNYHLFVSTSAKIDKIETDLIELRSHLTEFTTNLRAMVYCVHTHTHTHTLLPSCDFMFVVRKGSR